MSNMRRLLFMKRKSVSVLLILLLVMTLFVPAAANPAEVSAAGSFQIRTTMPTLSDPNAKFYYSDLNRFWKAGRLPVYLFAWGNNFAASAGGKTIGSSAGQKWIVPDSGKCLSGAGQGTAKAAAAFGSTGGAHCRKRYCTGLL